MVFIATAVSHYDDSKSISDNYKNICKKLDEGNHESNYARNIRVEVIPLLRKLFSSLFKQLDKVQHHLQSPNVDVEVIFKYKTGENNFVDDDLKDEFTKEKFVQTHIYRNKSRFEALSTTTYSLPSYAGGLHSSILLLFHKVNHNNELIQPKINHHLINHHSDNFKHIRSMIHQNVFRDTSSFHFCILGHKTINPTREQNMKDLNRHFRHLMHPLDSTQSSNEIDSLSHQYTTTMIPLEVFQNEVLPFLSSLDGYNMFTFRGMKYLDEKLSVLSKMAMETVATSKKGSSSKPSLFSCEYNPFFDPPNNNDISDSTASLNSEIFYSTFCNFRHHVQRHLSFSIGTVEGIHRMFSLNDKETIIMANAKQHGGDTASYCNSFHLCILSNLQASQNTNNTEATLTEIEGQNGMEENSTSTEKASDMEVLERTFRQLRAISKSYLLDKEKNVKSSAFDTIMSLIDSEHCEYNIFRLLDREKNSNKDTFWKFFESKMNPLANHFRKSIEMETKSVNSFEGEKDGFPNITNEFIRELFDQCNITDTCSDFLKKIKPTDDQIMSDVLDVSKISFACNKYNASKRNNKGIEITANGKLPILKCFKEVFNVRTNAGNWMRNNHTILIAMQFVSAILSLHKNSYRSYNEKLQEAMHLRKQLSQQDNGNVIARDVSMDPKPIQRHFDFRFLCKFILYFIFLSPM